MKSICFPCLLGNDARIGKPILLMKNALLLILLFLLISVVSCKGARKQKLEIAHADGSIVLEVSNFDYTTSPGETNLIFYDEADVSRINVLISSQEKFFVVLSNSPLVELDELQWDGCQALANRSISAE